jgi:tetratricopeptide (TPR) repeat protein
VTLFAKIRANIDEIIEELKADLLDKPEDELNIDIKVKKVDLNPDDLEKIEAKERAQKDPGRILQPETFQEKMAAKFKKVALFLLELGEYPAAKLVFLQVVEIYDSIEVGFDQKKVLSAFHNLGYLCSVQNNPAEAVSWYVKELDLAEKCKIDYSDKRRFQKILQNLGVSYFHAAEFEKSHLFLQWALDKLEVIFKDGGIEYEADVLYHWLGRASVAVGNPDKAIFFFEKSSEMLKLRGKEKSELFIENVVRIAETQKAQKLFLESLKSYENALAVFEGLRKKGRKKGLLSD